MALPIHHQSDSGNNDKVQDWNSSDGKWDHHLHLLTLTLCTSPCSTFSTYCTIPSFSHIIGFRHLLASSSCVSPVCFFIGVLNFFQIKYGTLLRQMSKHMGVRLRALRHNSCFIIECNNTLQAHKMLYVQITLQTLSY